MILSMDMSLRSSGVCIIDKEDNLIHFELIKTEKEDFIFDEDLIIYLSDKIINLIHKYPIDQFVIEGLSFNSKSSRKDVIAGIYWTIRTLIRKTFPSIPIGSIPVRSWRSWVISTADLKDLKKVCPDNLKNGPLMKLPFAIREMFLEYTIKNGHHLKSIFDLSDAYWIAVYRNSLN